MSTEKEIDFKEAKVTGESILAMYRGLPDSMDEMCRTMLHKHGILSVQPEKWYSFEAFLLVIKEIENIFGDGTIYEIGKKMFKTEHFPSKIKKVTKVVESCHEVFKLNHTNFNCSYTIDDFNKKSKCIIITIINFYPIQFNRGMLTALFRSFPPKRDALPEVQVDNDASVYPKCKYIITW